MADFHSHTNVRIHQEMIKDSVVMDTYRAAIMRQQSSISGKVVVVHVGCGTGLLSIFCARAGVRRVYAIDASDIAVQANEVMKANNLSNIVVVLHRRVEDVEINEEVDVIISEWMGYMLLHMSMLGSVIIARDRWLKKGGLILPSNATLCMAPITHSERYNDSIDFWCNVHGIDMSAMLPLAKQCAFEEPRVDTITFENILAWPHVVKRVNCYSITIQELESVTRRYKLESMTRAPLHGFAFWFDLEFDGPGLSPTNHHSSPQLADKAIGPSHKLVLSTAPGTPPTHWQQTLIYFYDAIVVEQEQLIEGSVTLSQSKQNPHLMFIRLD